MKSQSVVQGLTHLLANTAVIASKVQNFHWNVVGPEFLTLHPFFGECYETLTGYMDSIAERIRALGHPVSGRMADYLRNASLQEAPEHCPSAQAMLTVLLSDYGQLIKATHELVHSAEEAHDEVSSDLCLAQQAYYEKTLWVLRSLVGR